MKSIKLRKIGLILAGTVFAVAMAFNFQYSLNGADQEVSSISESIDGVSLSDLIYVSQAQAEEVTFYDFEDYNYIEGFDSESYGPNNECLVSFTFVEKDCYGTGAVICTQGERTITYCQDSCNADGCDGIQY